MTMTAAEHIHTAEIELARAEECGDRSASLALATEANAHATLAVAELLAGQSAPSLSLTKDEAS